MGAKAARCLLFVGSLSLVPTLASAQTLVDTCGQVISDAGYLAADLDCSASMGTAVTIDDGGSLNLAGFTITAAAADSAVKCEFGACEVFSEPPGGELVGGYVTLSGANGQSTTLRNLVVRDAGHTCARGGKLRVFDTQIQNCFLCAFGFQGVYMERATITGCDTGVLASSADVNGAKGTIIDSVISGNENGIDDTKAGLLVINSEISGNSVGGVRGSKVQLENTTVVNNGGYGAIGVYRLAVTGGEISGNGFFPDPFHTAAASSRKIVVDGADVTGNAVDGIAATRSVKVSGSTVAGNGRDGISAARVSVNGSSVTVNGGYGLRSHAHFAAKAKLLVRNSVVKSNGLFGVLGTGSAEDPNDCTEAGSVAIRDSDLTNNGLDPDCGVTEACGSIASCTEPRARSAPCDTSYVVGSGLPGDSWGICALD